MKQSQRNHWIDHELAAAAGMVTDVAEWVGRLKLVVQKMVAVEKMVVDVEVVQQVVLEMFSLVMIKLN